MTAIYDVFVNGVNKGGPAEDAGLTTEEVLGSSGQCVVVIQDRAGTYEPQTHDEIKIVIHSSSWVLFHGEVISIELDLAVAFPFRRWKLTCSDANVQLPQRKVGALDGTQWVDADGFGDYIMVDEDAQTLSTDKQTVQNLFDVYMRYFGIAFETNTYVGTYLPVDSFIPIKWLYTDLQAALDALAALVTANLQFWLDPDDFVHWSAIPAWQDIAQDVLPGTTGSLLVDLFPEFDFGTTQLAPTGLDADNPVPGTSISFRGLKVTEDGSTQPEQIYVRGGTGFVHDTGIPPSPFPDNPPTASPASATYTLSFNRATTVYTRTSKGYVGTASTYSGPFAVPYVVVPLVVPRDPVNHTGGNFWLIKTGPATGKIVSQHTAEGLVHVAAGTYNTFNVSGTPAVITSLGSPIDTGGFSANYDSLREYQWPSHSPKPSQASLLHVTSGSHSGIWLHSSEVGHVLSPQVTVVTVLPPPVDPRRQPATPIVSVGGSGWVGYTTSSSWRGTLADRNKRQAYLDEPNSVNQQDRDAVAGQALYRAKSPVLRGTLICTGGTDKEGNVLGPDGWRVGQLVKITDARLPARLNARYFVVQRVAMKTIQTQNVREYTLDWGDGPTARTSGLRAKKPPTPPPANGFYIDVAEVQPAPLSTQVVPAQLINGYGQAWAIEGKVVNWQLVAVDKDWVEVKGQGSLTPAVSTTDDHGIARTVFTAGDQTGLTYFIYCDSPVESVP